MEGLFGIVFLVVLYRAVKYIYLKLKQYIDKTIRSEDNSDSGKDEKNSYKLKIIDSNIEQIDDSKVMIDLKLRIYEDKY